MSDRGAGSPLRQEPLWVRVDRNRLKLSVFVVLFVFGSAALLTIALVVVPGVLLGLGAYSIDLVPAGTWFGRLAIVVGVAFLAMLALGIVLATAQLANAEDWVRHRFEGRELTPGESPPLERAVTDMAVAGGLGEPPRLFLLETDAVNALAIGTTRSRPLIGVTRGFLSAMSEAEQRAVVATLTSRVLTATSCSARRSRRSWDRSRRCASPVGSSAGAPDARPTAASGTAARAPPTTAVAVWAMSSRTRIRRAGASVR